MPARWVACLMLAMASCTPAQVPRARMVCQVAALGGIAGLVASTLAASATDDAEPFAIGFSVVSAAGIIGYALIELTSPGIARPPAETLQQRHRRWAKILTGRAAGAAREGNCPRVRRLEVRVRVYDPEVHDFVFMRDPEIVRCLQSQ